MTSSSAKPVSRSLARFWAASFGDEPVSRTSWFARCAVLFYVLVLPFSHNAALKNFGLVAMLIALALSLITRSIYIEWRSPVLVSVLAVLGLALVSSVAGSSVAENLIAYRKQFLPLLLLLILSLSHFRRRPALVLLLGVMAAAFGVRTMLALYEMATTTREHGMFFKGYGMEAALYTAPIAGLVMAVKGRWRVFAGGLLMLTCIAAVTNGSRTGVVAIALGCLTIPLLLGRLRLAVTFIVAGMAIAAIVITTKPQLSQHYELALKPSSYVGPTGMSTRYPIWLGVWQIAQQKPLLGHGFGWKKLGDTAIKEGFVAKWDLSDDPYLKIAAWYFSLPTDKVNPHNLALQVLFETGFAGFAAYAAMLALLFWYSVTSAFRGPREWRPLAATVAGFLVSYIVVNVSNGLWIGAGPSTVLVAMLEACRRAGKEIS